MDFKKYLPKKIPVLLVTIILSVAVAGTLIYFVVNLQNKNEGLKSQIDKLTSDLNFFKNRDEAKRNDDLELQIKNIEKTYGQSVSVYESLVDLHIINPKLDKKFDILYAGSIFSLAKLDYSSGSSQLASLSAMIKTEKDKIIAAAAAKPAISAPVNNSAPESGFNSQTVQTDRGSFVVNIISADLGSTRVIVDTASDGNCSNDCPVLSLGDYVARSGAFAGVNGSYFCPASYPSCAGKTNSFDLLVMNKQKTYINSENNVYSTNPAAIFGNGWIRFVGRAQEWGRDTSVDGVISNFPLLVSGSNVAFGGNDDPKQGSKGSRSFVGNRGSKVYIGVVFNASVADAAVVLKTLGLENALNLDDGGSTALWSGGYRAGPGRAIPNAVLFVRK